MKFADALKGKPRPALQKVILSLQKLPNGEVFNKQELQKLGIYETLRHFNTDPEILPYRCKTSMGVFWGNQKAIKDFAALRKGEQ